MNEADKRVIEELLNKQAERLEKRMDTRFQEQEQRLDVRFQEQEQRLEKRMIHIFNEGFEQIVLPHIAKIEKDIEDLQFRTGRIERTLNAVIDRQDRQGEEIKNIKKFLQMPEGA
ncbi:MAG: hypothetical protein AB1743_09015 [Actinomycetota bacterium]